jgi:hypothetical protein
MYQSFLESVGKARLAHYWHLKLEMQNVVFLFSRDCDLMRHAPVNYRTLQHRFAYFETPSRTGIIRKLPVYLSQVEEHLSILQSVLFNWCTSQMSQKFAKRQAGAANIGTPSRTGIVRKLPVYLWPVEELFCFSYNQCFLIGTHPKRSQKFAKQQAGAAVWSRLTFFIAFTTLCGIGSHDSVDGTILFSLFTVGIWQWVFSIYFFLFGKLRRRLLVFPDNVHVVPATCLSYLVRWRSGMLRSTTKAQPRTDRCYDSVW